MNTLILRTALRINQLITVKGLANALEHDGVGKAGTLSKIPELGRDSMRMLFYGAGVIGSLYAAKVAQLSRVEVSVLARGQRYEELKNRGLLIKSIKKEQIESATASIISELKPQDIYDYIVVTLRKDQVNGILPILQENKSKNIVFMVNNPLGADEWINILGEGRVILGFPGAGGKREEGIIHYHIVSSLIQPTTLGEIDGSLSKRLNKLCNTFSKAGFRVAVSKEMDNWQKTHIAMVSPMANVIYMCGGDNYTVAGNKEAINLMNSAIQEGMQFLNDYGYKITPNKLNVLRVMPRSILNILMSMTYRTKWAETVISNHALVAREEMKVLANDFMSLAKRHNCKLPAFGELSKYI